VRPVNAADGRTADGAELLGLSAVVVGLARSGIAAAATLARRGAKVVATDLKPRSALSQEALDLEALGVRLELGGHRAATFAAGDVVVVSPGVPWDLPELLAARKAGAQVLAELEMGARLLRGPIVAVTGTKGKSTTTAVLGAMLQEAGIETRVGGNIGSAITGLVEGATAKTVFVLEASSFQLEGTDLFHPKVALFLNLSADHLDRHADFESYARAKARIFANQTPDDWALVNGADPRVLSLAEAGKGRQLRFFPGGAESPIGSDDAAFFRSDRAWLRLSGAEEQLFRLESLRVPGPHLASDLLAAAAAARLLGATADAVARAAETFPGLEHVLERVAEVAGVVFFNDSKATNVEAARRSIEALDRPVVAIVGGRYKGGDFADLAPAVLRHGRAVLAIGEARDRVAAALGSSVPVTLCTSLDEAVERAAAVALPGDAVVLAPACSSFDMFGDYAERGRAFKEAVGRLTEARSERRPRRGAP
jgi:UDP-N-acetylmuramoylalanine--D-glutamate ligase